MRASLQDEESRKWLALPNTFGATVWRGTTGCTNEKKPFSF
jgi:hypothetical protein